MGWIFDRIVGLIGVFKFVFWDFGLIVLGWWWSVVFVVIV